ncbi:MAG: polymer-forming cytoskeletal protein [Hyphomicrobiaceae bacterium]|nr:MAG: polymer-forming cytoskeletal protein [Hyphomicrobiaceae bacterium]
MFTKKPEKDGPVMDAGKSGFSPLKPAGGPPQVPGARTGQVSRGGGTPSVIGSDLTITGNLESKGEIQIEGEIQGDIHAARVIVGERARITGSLLADDIIVRGNVAGSIRGNNVTLQSNSHVEGDVFHKSLAIEQGAFFEGKSRRSEDPTAVQRNANGMPPPS